MHRVQSLFRNQNLQASLANKPIQVLKGEVDKLKSCELFLIGIALPEQ
jgi:hypothetical protein